MAHCARDFTLAKRLAYIVDVLVVLLIVSEEPLVPLCFRDFFVLFIVLVSVLPVELVEVF
jgi:hypothetical protein